MMTDWAGRPPSDFLPASLSTSSPSPAICHQYQYHCSFHRSYFISIFLIAISTFFITIIAAITTSVSFFPITSPAVQYYKHHSSLLLSLIIQFYSSSSHIYSITITTTINLLSLTIFIPSHMQAAPSSLALISLSAV